MLFGLMGYALSCSLYSCGKPKDGPIHVRSDGYYYVMWHMRYFFGAMLVALIVCAGCKRRYVDSDTNANKSADSICKKDTSFQNRDTMRTDSSAFIKYDKQ